LYQIGKVLYPLHYTTILYYYTTPLKLPLFIESFINLSIFKSLNTRYINTYYIYNIMRAITTITLQPTTLQEARRYGIQVSAVCERALLAAISEAKIRAAQLTTSVEYKADVQRYRNCKTDFERNLLAENLRKKYSQAIVEQLIREATK